jgi:hypothetical protein
MPHAIELEDELLLLLSEKYPGGLSSSVGAVGIHTVAGGSKVTFLTLFTSC